MLITIAFHSGYDVVHCYFTTSLLITGSVGTLVYTPCIFIALLDADKRHIVMVKGDMCYP